MVDSKQKHVDLYLKAEKVKTLVDQTRKHVNKNFCSIPKFKAHVSKYKIFKQELKKVKDIKCLPNKITDDYLNIMINEAKDCKKIIGKAPSKFAIIGMGSQALKKEQQLWNNNIHYFLQR